MTIPIEVSLWAAFVAAFTVFGGVSCVYLSLKYFKNPIINKVVKEVMESLKIEELIHQKLEAWDLSKDVEEPLDNGLNRLVESLKIQIPMAAMFLSGPLVDKLKGIAKQEITKMIPDIKKKLFSRIKTELDCQALVEKGVNTFFNTHFFPLLRHQLVYWGGIGALVAFIFFGLLTWGLVQIRF